VNINLALPLCTSLLLALNARWAPTTKYNTLKEVQPGLVSALPNTTPFLYIYICIYIYIYIYGAQRALGTHQQVQHTQGGAQNTHPETRNLKPYTLHPTPYTLHPEPDPLHPTPDTLHTRWRTARYSNAAEASNLQLNDSTRAVNIATWSVEKTLLNRRTTR